MKKSATLLLSALLVSLSLFAATSASAAETETKSKAKSTAKEEPKKASTTKSKAKAKEEPEKGGLKAADAAELKVAEGLLKDLTTAKKTSLTKLLNSGTKKELTQLPGIGDATADAIIEARPLESAAHLILIKGMGEKTFSEVVKSRK